MSKTCKVVMALGIVCVLVVAGAFATLVQHGLSARDAPTTLEAWTARTMRRLAVPSASRRMRNPVPLTDAALTQARAHFADHCASCHGNDGKGATTLGRNLYPKAPDMTGDETQRLTDGEIFYTITSGIRLTGMPAWGAGTAEDNEQTWKLVHFIRDLRELTPEQIEEMEGLNPRTRAEFERQEEEKRFLNGQ